jgi:hypothetical protein
MLYLCAAAFGVLVFHIDARISEDFEREMDLQLRTRQASMWTPDQPPHLRLVHDAGRVVQTRIGSFIAALLIGLSGSFFKALR